jgi:RNA polymerase sigma-70 factor (ECF subfamily)
VSPTGHQESVAEEAGLLGQIATGDESAFEQLYRKYSGPLFSLGLRMLENEKEAEEALQDTFVKLWNKADSYDARKSRPFTWSVTIMRRTCIDRIRKNNRRPVATTLEEVRASQWAIQETVRKTTELNDEVDRVKAAMQTIPPHQKQALELALFSGMTHTEIAENLKQPLGTVKTWLRRGMFQLSSSLTEHAK